MADHPTALDRVPIPTDVRGEPHTDAGPAGPWGRSAATRRGAVGLLVATAAWWLVTDVLAAPGDLLARFSPLAAFPAVVELFRSGGGVLHLVVTVERLLVGLGLAVALGAPLGVAVGRSTTVAQYTGALFQFLRMVSPLAWTPIAIIVLGVGDAPVYFLVAVAAVWPVLLNAAAGVHALDPGWLQVARSLGATPTEQLRTIVLPGIRAHLATGIRVALGTAWIVIVPAEMLGVDSGLGYAILDARDRLRYDELMGVIVVIGVLGFTLDALAQRLAGRGGRRRSPRRRPARGRPPRRAPDPAAQKQAAAR
jgi:NitT/TauT family transport system permease protein